MLPGPDVTLKRLSNHHVEVKSGRTKAKLMGLSADEYPSLPSYDEVKFISVDAKVFSHMVDKTLYAASTDETRYNLNGVLFEPKADEPGGVTMVATDGHRLALAEMPAPDRSSSPNSCQEPVPTAHERPKRSDPVLI